MDKRIDHSRRLTFAEIALAAMVIFGLLAAEIVATHARSMFHATPWLDEVHTLIVVNDPDPAKFRSAMSDQCVDANFPVYNQLLRWLHLTSAPAIREVSCASTAIALLGIYILLRGAFDPVASATGVLTVWSGPLIVSHSFQGRFYAPWMAAVVWFAVALRCRFSLSPRARAGSAVAVAITAIFACTLHAIGLPAIALVACSEMVLDRRSFKQRIITALPALAGVIAVAVFVPMTLAQKHSFAIPSWLVGNPIRLLYSTLVGVIPGTACAVLIVGLFISAWIDRLWPPGESRSTSDLAPIAGFSALLLLPAILLVMTILLQPVLLPRYALVTAAAFAGPAALLASRMRRGVAIVLCVALLAESGAELSRRVREASQFREEYDGFIIAIRAQPELPALFESRHQLYPIAWIAPDLRDRCAYIDFQPGPNQPDKIVEGAERDVAKKFDRLYGWPRVMAWERVIAQPRFILVSLDEDTERISRRFDGFRVEQKGRQRFELTRK
jgi:hypothetical protein